MRDRARSARSARSGVQNGSRGSFASSTRLEAEIDTLLDKTQTGDHFLSPSQIEICYRTNINTGLTEAMAAELLALNGPNALKELKGVTYSSLFVRNMFGWFPMVLWIGAALNLLAYFISKDASGQQYLSLGVIIALTVAITGLFGFYQEAKNLKVMSGFEKLVPPAARVIRDGVKKIIPSPEVTLGDIVEIQGGDMVPADIRILSCSGFKTDMSALTGETTPIHHTTYYTHVNPLESKNMAYFSCPAVEGVAKGVVIAVGEMTQIGKIAGLVTGLKKEETPIQKEINHFIVILVGVALFFGIIFFIMVMFVEDDGFIAFRYSLGILLANVPEGLIITLVASMTVAASRLKAKNCMAKNLQAVETLGSTSCICSDKTGTLTQNLMSVSHLYFDGHLVEAQDFANASHGIYQELSLAASLCLKAYITDETKNLEIDKKKIIGDASECAILRYMEAYFQASVKRETNPKVSEIPFSSVYKYHVTIHLINPQAPHYYLIMKGAPEIVIEFCSTLATENGDVPLGPAEKNILKNNFIKTGNMGERVIGYCDMHLPLNLYPIGYQFDPENKNFSVDNLRFLGFISLIDPPRKNISDYLKKCRDAGVQVVMVTGDHPVTALAISRKCGTITHQTAYDFAFENNMEISEIPKAIKDKFKAVVVTGDELRLMSTDDLRQIILQYPEMTFARTSPQQKLEIVETFQSLDYVVAVTGDGVNDSPALRKANIGIAMGITGTEVSKQAADMILLDDNFASIVIGIEEGRRIFDNLKKTIAYTLTSNTPQMMPFVLYAILGIPLPLSIILIIVINVGTDILPALSLAYEESEEDIMKHPPRKPNEHLVNGPMIFMTYYQVGLVQFFCGLNCFFVVMAEKGFFPSTLMNARTTWDNPHYNDYEDVWGRKWPYEPRMKLQKLAQTAYFAAICITQISDVIICKTRRISLLKKGMTNWFLDAACVVAFLIVIICVYVPFLNDVLGTEPLSWYHFMIILPFFILMILMDEARRYIIRNGISRWVEKETYY